MRNQLNSGLSNPAYIKIPALFKEVYDPVDKEYQAVAYLPGMVNMLVIGNRFVIPTPFGPKNPTTDIFEDDVEAKLSGYTVKFVDDWDTYHTKHGEIHCGTNVKRTPPSTNWWE